MSTLREVKAAAASLPVEERSELITWLNVSEEVLKLRYEQLRREIQVGLNEIEHGEVELLDVAEIKRSARARWEAERRADDEGVSQRSC